MAVLLPLGAATVAGGTYIYRRVYGETEAEVEKTDNSLGGETVTASDEKANISTDERATEKASVASDERATDVGAYAKTAEDGSDWLDASTLDAGLVKIEESGRERSGSAGTAAAVADKAHAESQDQYGQSHRLVRAAVLVYRARGYNGSITIAHKMGIFTETCTIAVKGGDPTLKDATESGDGLAGVVSENAKVRA